MFSKEASASEMALASSRASARGFAASAAKSGSPAFAGSSPRCGSYVSSARVLARSRMYRWLSLKSVSPPPAVSARCILRKKPGVNRWNSFTAAASPEWCGGSGKLTKTWDTEPGRTCLRRTDAASPPMAHRFGAPSHTARLKMEYTRSCLSSSATQSESGSARACATAQSPFPAQISSFTGRAFSGAAPGADGSEDRRSWSLLSFLSFLSFLDFFSFLSGAVIVAGTDSARLGSPESECRENSVAKSTRPSSPSTLRRRALADATVTFALTAHARSSPYASHRRPCSVDTSASTSGASFFSAPGAPGTPSPQTSTRLSNTSARVKYSATSGFSCAPFLTRFRNPPTRFSSRRSSARVVLLYVAVAEESASAPARVAALISTFWPRVCVSSASGSPATAPGSPSLDASASASSSALLAVSMASLAASASSSSAAQCARLTCMDATASAVSTSARCVFSGSWKNTHAAPRSHRPAFQN
mmetsp:Transcript_13661/g.57427  ORF Transcript_13661/g.57427 Transcript_13661/m.57427 type:complete len:477 (+) Transcript_13661:261-1691(+)